MTEQLRLFHGGIPDLRVGDVITPHEPNVIDDCPICQARAAGLTYTVDGHAIDPPTGRPDRVYVTTDREYARFYASKYRLGDLYRVEPATPGDLEPSTEDPFPTWTTTAARITSIYSKCIRLTWGERRRLQRRWAAVDAQREAAS